MTRGWDEAALAFLRGDDESLMARAGVGVPRQSTGRHPIEILTARSACTDLAVRTHVPVLVDGWPVLIPIAGATQIMRDISAAVWGEHQSPLELAAFDEGLELASRIARAVLEEDL